MRFLYILFICVFFIPAYAQIKEQTAWLAYINSIKFNSRWGMHLDVQLRSNDNLEHVRNLLIRPGITYYTTKKTNVTVGYLLNDTYTRLIGAPDTRLSEHRIWQQFIYNQSITAGTILTHRLRTEQRFIERPAEKIFAQRLRYFVRAIVPLVKQDSSFKKGSFFALQNELFFNVQHKEKLNGSFYDQNRAYGAIGYRLSKKADLEAGYLYQSVNGLTNNTNNNVFQLAVYTRF